MEEKNSVGCSVASMVLGICSLVLGCCFWYVSIPCAIVGVILGGVSLSSKKGGKGMAVAGVVTSIIGLVPAIIGIALGGSLFTSLGLF